MNLINEIIDYVSTIKVDQQVKSHYIESKGYSLKCVIDCNLLNIVDYSSNNNYEEQMFRELEILDDSMLSLLKYDYDMYINKSKNRHEFRHKTIDMIKYLLPLENQINFRLFLRTTYKWCDGIDSHDYSLCGYKGDLDDYFNNDICTWNLFILPNN